MGVYRLAYNGDVARRSPGQLAVFQGGPSRTGGKAPLSGFIRVDPARRRKNSQLTARRVALKMGRRPRDVGEASSLCAPGRSKARRFAYDALPAAHFERNDVIIIGETVH
jgi:hypothetical protein